tara:strand:+ start:1589 stop:3724 length:2136 start_codon:yes stop_codon:yes gene_type:complete
MQELQLYIESDRLDLFKDEMVSLTQTIQNVKQIDKVFTAFTKTFSVPASKTNNKIFKHYYNFNITNGYDARKKKAGRIELNTLPFQTGRIRLDGVTLKNNLAHTYKITFFGNTVELTDILGEDKLGSLAFGDSKYDLTYSAAGVLAKMQQATGANAYVITPLITHTDRLFFESGVNAQGSNNLWYHSSHHQGVWWNQLKFALRLYEIIKEIEIKYTVANGYNTNLVFSEDFFSTSNLSFYNLYMWLHRKSGAVEPDQQIPTFESLVNNWTASASQIIVDYSTITIPATLVTAPNKITTNTITCTPIGADAAKPYSVVVSLNGSTVFTSTQAAGTQTILPGLNFLVANGVYTVSIIHPQTSGTIVFTSIEWEISGEVSGGVYNDTATRNSFTASESFDFQIPQQIPDVTIMSFLTGLFKMFNLVAYVNDSGEIVVRPLEATSGVDYSYYTSADIDGLDAPVDYNISEYVDTTQSEVNIALPYKEIVYAYEGTGTYLAKQHNQLFGTSWGALKYIGGTDTDGTGGLNYNTATEVYKVIAPFEHMKYERLVNVTTSGLTTIQWGYSVNENEQPYIGKPLIFYGIRQSGGFNISYRSSSNAASSEDAYWIPSNALYQSSSSGKENIHFNNELNEYEVNSDQFTETLFSVYHSEYIIDVFNQARRLTQITSYLPLKIIYNFKLNDTFTINAKTYRINSITTELQSGKSKMELLNKV